MADPQSSSKQRPSGKVLYWIIIVVLIILCLFFGFKAFGPATERKLKVETELDANSYILLQDIPKPPRVDNNPKQTLEVILSENEKIREVKREIPKIFAQLRPYTENNEFIWIINPQGDTKRVDLYKGIQRALKLIETYQGEINGDWKSTEAAVIEFQSQFAIANDGYFGRNTLGKICTIYLDQLSQQEEL